MTKTILLRFVRGFVASGVGQIAAYLAANQFNVSSLADLQSFLFILLTSFIIGGLLGLDKILRYEEDTNV